MTGARRGRGNLTRSAQKMEHRDGTRERSTNKIGTKSDGSRVWNPRIRDQEVDSGSSVCDGERLCPGDRIGDGTGEFRGTKTRGTSGTRPETSVFGDENGTDLEHATQRSKLTFFNPCFKDGLFFIVVEIMQNVNGSGFRIRSYVREKALFSFA